MARSGNLTQLNFRLIIIFCLFIISLALPSCSSSEEEQDSTPAEPVTRYMDSMNKSIKTAKTITNQANLNGVKDQLLYHTMQNGGNYPTMAEFSRLVRNQTGMTYTGQGLDTTAGDRGVVAYIAPVSGKTQYHVLLANSKIIQISKEELDAKLKISEKLKKTGA